MGYLFLAFALLTSSAKGFFGKKTSGIVDGFKDAMLANTIRMAFCIVIGLAVMLFSGELSDAAPTPELLLISALSGISTAAFVVSWLVAIKKSAYMMMDVVLMLGTMIPLILSDFLFGEQITPIQWFGVAILIIAAVIMCSYNNSIKEQLTLPSLLLLLFIGLSNGVTDFSQKLFVKSLPDTPISAFNFYTYIFAALTLCVSFGAASLKNREKISTAKLSKISVYILIMAVCLFANSFFKTLAAQELDSILLYPLNQGASLVLSAVMSVTLFKEKLTFKGVLGIIVAFVGIIVINVL